MPAVVKKRDLASNHPILRVAMPTAPNKDRKSAIVTAKHPRRGHGSFRCARHDAGGAHPWRHHGLVEEFAVGSGRRCSRAKPQQDRPHGEAQRGVRNRNTAHRPIITEAGMR